MGIIPYSLETNLDLISFYTNGLNESSLCEKKYVSNLHMHLCLGSRRPDSEQSFDIDI